MKIVKRVIFFCILFSILSCVGSCHHVKENSALKESFIIIDVQPFTGISEEERCYVFNELGKIYPYIELKNSISLPPSAFYSKRKRYRADSLICYLNTLTPAGHVTIGLTNKDVSATKGSIEDWGVMGLGFCPGKACIVSGFRLSKKEKFLQLFKVSIHELGHTQGLSHCSVTSCFMRDAEGHNPTNEEKEFCKDCKSFLTDKGWKFK